MNPKTARKETHSESLSSFMRRQNYTRLSPTLGSLKCTIMSIFNLAEPEWISVNCLQKIPTNVVCAEGSSTPRESPHTKDFQRRRLICRWAAIRKNDTCFSFVWLDGKTMNEGDFSWTCKTNYKSKKTSSAVLSILKPSLFYVITNYNFTVISPRNYSQDNVTQTHYHWAWFKKTLSQRETSIQDSKGYQICSSSVEKVIISFSNTFLCNRGQYISSLLVLDGNDDCQDAYSSNGTEDTLTKSFTSSDELCFSRSMKCPPACQDPQCTCSPLQHKTKNGQCISYLHSLPNNVSFLKNVTNSQTCSPDDNQIIGKDLMNDLVVDCKESAYDEPIYTALLMNFTFYQCERHGQIPCLQGHSKCFSISEICFYELNNFGHLTPCRIGSHLESCTLFECNSHYKCPSSYCVPWHLRCNGNWDCPYGQDESISFSSCKEMTCAHLFKCHSSSRCVHPEDICDEIPHCPFQDDEDMCFTKPQSCPEQSYCFNLALSCIAVFLQNIQQGNFNFRSLHIIQSGIDSLGVFGPIDWLVNANFTQNKITHICSSMDQFTNIVSLDISHNHVFELCSKCFHNLGDIKWISMKSNQLRVVQERSFINLPAIRYIDISQNVLLKLYTNTFENISNKMTLELSFNMLHEIDTDIFQKQFLTYLVTDMFSLCCITPPETTCISNLKLTPNVFSCSELLASKAVRIYTVILCVLLLVLNCLSLLVHSQTKNKPGKNNIFFLAICFGHIISVIYLSILVSTDLYYQGEFVVKQTLWTKTITCTMAFMFSKFFIISVPFMFAQLSFARMMIVIFPLSSEFKNESCIAHFVGIGLFVAACLSVSFGLWQLFFCHSLNKLCSQFTGTKASSVIQNLSVSVIHFLIAFLVPAFDIWMLKCLDKQQKAVQELFTGHRVQKSILFKVLITTVPNVLCWIASGATVLFFELFDIEGDTFVWPVILIMPINGIINPVIFVVIKLKSTKSLQNSLSNKDNLTQQQPITNTPQYETEINKCEPF